MRESSASKGTEGKKKEKRDGLGRRSKGVGGGGDMKNDLSCLKYVFKVHSFNCTCAYW